MARVPLLDDDESPHKTSYSGTSASWTHRLMSQLSGQDELTFAIAKATNCLGPAPKEKYVSYLIGLTTKDPNIIEEILLRFSALSDWSEHRVIACKTLVFLHQLLQRLDRYYNKNPAVVIFLTEVKERWSRQDEFLGGYTIALLHRVLMDVEHPSLANTVYDSLAALATNSMSVLKSYSPADLLLFLTNLLSYLERMTALGSKSMSSLTSAERQAYSYANSFIASECRALLTVTGHLLGYLLALADFEAKASLFPLEAQLGALRDTWRMGPSSGSGSGSGKSSPPPPPSAATPVPDFL